MLKELEPHQSLVGWFCFSHLGFCCFPKIDVFFGFSLKSKVGLSDREAVIPLNLLKICYGLELFHGLNILSSHESVFMSFSRIEQTFQT